MIIPSKFNLIFLATSYVYFYFRHLQLFSQNINFLFFMKFSYIKLISYLIKINNIANNIREGKNKQICQGSCYFQCLCFYTLKSDLNINEDLWLYLGLKASEEKLARRYYVWDEETIQYLLVVILQKG